MKTIPLILLIAVLTVVGTAAAAQLTVKVDSVTAKPGSTVTVPVSVSGASGIGGMDFAVIYDPAFLTLKKAEAGQSVKDAVFQANAAKPGVVGISIVDANGISADGAVAQLTFDVKGADGKTSPLKLTVRGITDTNIKDISYMTKSGTVTISSSAAGKAPLPSSVAAAAIGIAALAFVWRRR